METSTAAIVAAATEVAEANEIRAEHAQDVAEVVLEQAAAQVERAEEMAEDIARAAMETHLGQRISELEGKQYSWQDQLAELSAQLQTLQETVNLLQGQLAATATIAVSSQSTPPQSEPTTEVVTEAVTTLETVVPEAISQSAVEESPAPAPKQRRRIWT